MSAMGMVERVARVFHPNAWDGDAPHLREWSLGIARQAIAAMREPNSEMLQAGFPHIQPSPAHVYSIEAAWRAMVDAAIKEERKP